MLGADGLWNNHRFFSLPDMPKTRVQKESELTNLVAKLREMKAVVFASYAGLSVKDTTDLRRQLRDQQVDLLVAKKTLFRRALKDADLDPAIVDHISGAVSMAFGYTDEVLPAKLLKKFSTDHKAVELVGGIVQGQYIAGPAVMALAKLPSREELIAKTVWTIKAPLTGLVQVLNGNLRGLITILSAIKDKQPA